MKKKIIFMIISPSPFKEGDTDSVQTDLGSASLEFSNHFSITSRHSQKYWEQRFKIGKI